MIVKSVYTLGQEIPQIELYKNPPLEYSVSPFRPWIPHLNFCCVKSLFSIMDPDYPATVVAPV
jgi:hypothetical protein